MGCSSCGNKTNLSNTSISTSSNVLKNQTFNQNQEPCDYTDDILQNWLTKLKWFKDKGYYVKYNVKGSVINKYLGIVLTSMNINNKCQYVDILNGEIKTLVIFITGIQNV